MDGDILGTLLTAFMEVATMGTVRLIPEAKAILLLLATLEVALLGLWIAAGYEHNIAGSLLTMAFKTTLYLYLITHWNTLTRALVKGCIALGLLGSGGVISETDFTDPSRLAWFGISAMTLVYNRIFAYTGWDAIMNLTDILFTGGAASFCLAAFLVFALQVFVALLEFYVTSGCLVIGVAWGMVRQTSFVAEKAFASIWAHAIKLCIMAFITGIALPIMLKLSPAMKPSFGACVTLALAGWAIVVAAWRCPKIALGVLQGSPQLTSHDVTQAIRTTTQAMSTMVATMRTMGPSPSSSVSSSGVAAPRRPM